MAVYDKNTLEELVMSDEFNVVTFGYSSYQIDEAVEFLTGKDDTTHLWDLFREEGLARGNEFDHSNQGVFIATAEFLHKKLFNREPLVASDYNLLNPAPEGAPWQPRYHRLVAEFVGAHGHVMRNDASYYGWREYDQSILTAPAPVVYMANVSESGWEEFQGTFYTGSNWVAGVTVDIIRADNRATRMRYQGDLSDLMRSF